MPTNLLAESLRPGVEWVVCELKSLGWQAKTGVTYDLPYVRINVTGAQIRVKYAEPLFRNSWVWYLSKTNFDSAYYGDYHGKIAGLGESLDPVLLLKVTQAILFDPCAIGNIETMDSLGSLQTSEKIKANCPICKPNKNARKFPEGIFDESFNYFRRGDNLSSDANFQDFLKPLFYE